MMNKFESRWSIAIIGEVYYLVWKERCTFILVQQSKYSLYYKKQQQQKKNNMVLQDALSAVDAAKQFYKIIWYENNFNRFYARTVTTVEEHNIDFPDSHFRLKIGVSRMYLHMQKHISWQF